MWTSRIRRNANLGSRGKARPNPRQSGRRCDGDFEVSALFEVMVVGDEVGAVLAERRARNGAAEHNGEKKECETPFVWH